MEGLKIWTSHSTRPRAHTRVLYYVHTHILIIIHQLVCIILMCTICMRICTHTRAHARVILRTCAHTYNHTPTGMHYIDVYNLHAYLHAHARVILRTCAHTYNHTPTGMYYIDVHNLHTSVARTRAHTRVLYYVHAHILIIIHHGYRYALYWCTQYVCAIASQ